MKKFVLWLIEWLSKWVQGDQELMVVHLVVNTAQIALGKGEWIEFAPIKGTCGNISLSGNSLPVFSYRVFEKSLMEFILVKVEVSLPDRIQYKATIDSIKTSDPKRHGEEVTIKDAYKQPFLTLAWHLFRYFPIPRKSEELENHQQAKVSNGST